MEYKYYILFKLRKHKTFNYQPRFSEDNTSNSSKNPEEIKKDFISKWKRQSGNKVQIKSVLPLRTLILFLVLLLICMYVLEKRYM